MDLRNIYPDGCEYDNNNNRFPNAGNDSNNALVLVPVPGARRSDNEDVIIDGNQHSTADAIGDNENITKIQ